jgi:hypothetical protein
MMLCSTPMSTLGRASLVLVALVSVIGTASCQFLPPTACTLIGGYDGLMVDVEVTEGTLPPDSYTIVARVGDVELRLEEVLHSEGAASVDGDDDVVVDGKHLFLDGALFGSHGSIMVGFRDGGGGPSRVTIEIWRGETMLAQETYAPKYTPYYPNGESCAPALEQAHGSLAIMAP